MYAYDDVRHARQIRNADAAREGRSGRAIAIGAATRPRLEAGMFVRLGGLFGVAMIAVNCLLWLAD